MNRVDSVVVFQWLRHEDLQRILDGLVAELNQRLTERHGLALELAPEAADFLIDRGWDPKFGARPLKRALRRDLYQPLARALIKQGWPSGERLIAEKNGHGLTFRAAAPLRPPTMALSTQVRSHPRGVSRRMIAGSA
jgi:ATP-dependent Clp protease ATP-binding subunit ClpA